MFVFLDVGKTIQDWFGPVQALATVIGLPILVIYVWKTWQIAGETARSSAATEQAARATQASAQTSSDTLVEMHAAREAETAPYVVAHIDVTGGHAIYIEVTNIGRLPARNISITFEPPLVARVSASQPLPIPAFIEKPIPFLPPNHTLRSLIGLTFDVLNQHGEVPTRYTTNVSFSDASLITTYQATYILDLEVFRDTISSQQTDLGDIKKAVDDLTSQTKAIAGALDGIRDLLAEGIMLGNPTLLLEHVPTARTAVQAIETKQAELRRVCEAWLEQGDDGRWRNRDEFKRQVRAIQRQFNRLSAASLPTDLVGRARSLDSTLGGLLDQRFFLDGGNSLRSFTERVEGLLATLSTTEP